MGAPTSGLVPAMGAPTPGLVPTHGCADPRRCARRCLQAIRATIGATEGESGTSAHPEGSRKPPPYGAPIPGLVGGGVRESV